MTGLTRERLAGMRKCADSFEVSLAEVTCSGIKIPYGIALDAAYCLSDALAEIERLSASRPSCATCKWAREQNDYEKRRDGYVWCKEICAFVRPEETDGECLWGAK